MSDVKPLYKASNGQYLTQSLFVETARKPWSEATQPPVFSLHDDVAGFVNCRRTFVDLGDRTGYKWAMQYLGSYEHWERLLEAPFFREAVKGWTSELDAKLECEAVDSIRSAALGESPTAFQAAKYLADRNRLKPASRRGRPSKAELEGELKTQASVVAQERDDLRRIGLKLQ